MGLCICMFRKYFCLGVLLLCICFCINGVAATDNVTYDNGNYLIDGNQVISESVVNKSGNQDDVVESVNNVSVSNKDSGGVSNFNKHNFMSIQSSNYYGYVFNENTGIYYDDLQQAISSAWEGNKLIVYGGYYENIILSRNDLTITCVNQYNSTIGNLYVHFVSGCNISGFTINSMDLYNAYENIFCNNFFDYYEKFNSWPTSNPVIMISNSYYNLFESNRIKQNTNGLFILSGDSYSTFRFNFFDKIDYYPYGDIDVSSSYLDLDNNLWYWMEMESYSSGYFQSIKNELIRNQGSYVILDKWIVPKFNIVNYKPVLDFNFNNFNEDISPLGSMNKINILYQMYWDYNIMISEINNGYAELNLPYNTNSFYLLIDYYIPIMLFEDESFIFNKNTSNYYKDLQEAIDDIYTLNGHTLELYGSHSIGDIFLHKNLTINGLGLTINNLLTNNDGSGSKISNFIIKNLSIVNFNDLNFLNFAFDNLNIIDSNDLNFSNFVIENLKIINSTNLTFSNNQFRNVFVNNSNYINFTSNVIGSYFEVFNSDNLVFLRNQIYNLLVETSYSSMFSGNTFCGRLINLVNSSLFNNTIDGLTIYNSQIMDIISNNFSSNTYIEYSSDIVFSGNNFANIVFLGSSCIFNSNNISGNIQDSRSSVTGLGVWWRNVYNRVKESYYSLLQEAINFADPCDVLEVYGGYYENINMFHNYELTIIGLNESRINNLTIKNSNLCNISGFRIGFVELYNSHENAFNSNYFGGDYYDIYLNSPVISLVNSHENSFISNKIKQNNLDYLIVDSRDSSSVFKFNSFERAWNWNSAIHDIKAINSQMDLDNNLWYDIQGLVNNPGSWNFIPHYKNNLINNQNSEIIFDKMIIPRISIINNKLFVDFNYNNFGEDISYLGCMDKIELYVDYPSSLIYPIVEVVNGYIELKPNLFSSGFDVLFESFYISVNRFVFNHNTSKYYNILQEAIDDVSTLNGHVIDVVNPYMGNVVLYKNLTINSNGGSVNNFLVNNSGSGSRISGFNIQNLRLINSSDLKVLNNQINNLFVINSSFNSFISNNLKDNAEIIDSDGLNFSNNQIFSILFNNSNNNQILSNKINSYFGLNNSQDNVVSNNTVLDLFIENSNNFSLISNNISNNLTVLYSNNITFVSNNLGNISSNNSFANCSFNSIKGKINNFNGTVIANNNWWGTNNLTINDIMVTGSDPVVCDSWIVVNESIVNETWVIDFTHNNQGENVYSHGCIPDGVPVVIGNGTHNITTLYTSRGKVIHVLGSDSANLIVYVGDWSKSIDLPKPVVSSNLDEGWYNTTKNLILTANSDIDSNPMVYYNINNGVWVSSNKLAIITLNSGKNVVSFYVKDKFGNICPTVSLTYYIDTVAPTVTTNLVNGIYEGNINLTLIAIDNLDESPVVYYRINNGSWMSKIETASILLVNGTYVVSFYAKDSVGNIGPIVSLTYYIDTVAPTVSGNLVNGTHYNGNRNLTLTASDNYDENPTIYYRINNGSWISKIKTANILLTSGKYVIEYYSKDCVDNIGSTGSLTYYIDTVAPSVSGNLASGTYKQNKTLTLTASDNYDDNPTIYYRVNNGAWKSKVKTVDIFLINGNYAVEYYAKDKAGNTAVTKKLTYYFNTSYIDFSRSGNNVTLRLSEMNSNSTIYYKLDNAPNFISGGKSVTFWVSEGKHNVTYIVLNGTGTLVEGPLTLLFVCDVTLPKVNFSLKEGWYNTSKVLVIKATDNMNPSPYILYRLNSGDSIVVNGTASITLKEGVNRLTVFVTDGYDNSVDFPLLWYYIDLTPPNVVKNLEGGNYSSSQILRLNVIDNMDSNATLYYRVNGGNWTSISKSDRIQLVNGTYFIEYYAKDRVGNSGSIQNVTYNINATIYEEEYFPDIDVNLGDGWYNESQSLILEANGENLTVWYSINNGSFAAGFNKVVLNLTEGYYFIQYKAVDSFGNETTVKTLMIIINETGNLTLPGRVINYNTGKFYNDIQEAIDAEETVNGDYIEVLAGTYGGNYIVNKSVILAGVYGETTLVPDDSNNPILSLNCDDIIISGFILMNSSKSFEGAVYLNGSSNCTIYLNTFINNTCSISNNDSKISNDNWILNNDFQSNTQYVNYTLADRDVYLINGENYFIAYNNFKVHESIGLYLINISGSLIYGNVFTQNIVKSMTGLYISKSSNDIISNNTFTNLNSGLGLYYVENCSVISNIFTNNKAAGIDLAAVNNTNISFNSFYDNRWGIFVNNFESFELINVNATNNWWGTNSPTLGLQFENADIVSLYDMGNSLYFDPWIVANINPTSYKIINGKIYEAEITVDLTHNSNETDISALGSIPDGIIVDFISLHGNITNNSTIKNGKASAILTFDQSVTNNITGVMAFINNEMVYDSVYNVPFIELGLLSTAIDQETGLPLDFIYRLPMNGSVTWFTILWRETGLFTADIDLIYNGEVVLTKSVFNIAYFYYKDQYREDVFKAIKDLNSFIASNQYLAYNGIEGIFLNPEEAIALFLESLDEKYNLTSTEWDFIIYRCFDFIDILHNGVYYFGDSHPEFVLTDPDTGLSELISLPGNPTYRNAHIFYDNGVYDNGSGGYDVGFEGMKSYAIATTNVSDVVLSYWLGLKNNYAKGAMKAAYGTFLTALLVIYEHDRVADQAANAFNVSWNRTTPVMVSMIDDIEDSYITGESDHRMGMDVIGDPLNVFNFRMTCSFAFSLVEELVGHNIWNSTDIGSVTLGIFKNIAEGDKLVIYYSNGYLVLRTEDNDKDYLYIDLSTGIVRDARFGSIIGRTCYHDPITDRVMDYGEQILNNNSNEYKQLELVGNTSISFFNENSSSFNLGLSKIFENLGYGAISSFYNDMVGEYEDFLIDTVFKVGADVLGGFLIEIGALLAPESLGASTFLIIGGLALIAYGNDMFEDPSDPYNQFGFLLSLGLSFSPQTNLAKFIIKPFYRSIVRIGFRSQGTKFVLKEVFFKKVSIESIDNFITDLVQDQIINLGIYKIYKELMDSIYGGN